MTFKQWLINFEDVDLPIGDLARDIITDPDFPSSKDHDACLKYLESKTNWDAVFEAFDDAWDLYNNSIKKGRDQN